MLRAAGAYDRVRMVSEDFGSSWLERQIRVGIGVEGAAGDWWGSLVGVPWSSDLIHDPWKVAALADADAHWLVMLCDPVVRFAADPVTGAVRASANASFQRGLYADLLLRLWRIVPRERVLVLQQERCEIDPAGERARTLRFLELDIEPAPAASEPPSSEPATSLRDDQRRALARAYVAENRRLAALVPDLDLGLWEPQA
jgi:hypothetical protein